METTLHLRVINKIAPIFTNNHLSLKNRQAQRPTQHLMTVRDLKVPNLWFGRYLNPVLVWAKPLTIDSTLILVKS